LLQGEGHEEKAVVALDLQDHWSAGLQCLQGGAQAVMM
jgi:hypothetical protein